MFKLLKRLFAVFFLKKKNKDVPLLRQPKVGSEARGEEIKSETPPIIPISVEEVKERLETAFIPPKKEHRWRMPNNRLHIQYYGNNKLILSGKIESMRVTKLERALEIVRGIQSYCIRRAIFQDKKGEQIKII